jgi:hypothetical protein
MRMRRAFTIGTTVILLFGAAACGDDGGGDDPEPDTPTSTTEADVDTTTPDNAGEAVHAFFDDAYPEFADAIEGFGSVDLGDGEAQLSLTVGDEPADVDTGIAICEAALEFAEGAGYSSFEVEVQNDENGDGEELATGDLDDGCEAA